MTASLVIRIVSEADLLQNYICKLETDGNIDFVSIRLDKKRMSAIQRLVAGSTTGSQFPLSSSISSQRLRLLLVTFPWPSASCALCCSWLSSSSSMQSSRFPWFCSCGTPWAATAAPQVLAEQSVLGSCAFQTKKAAAAVRLGGKSYDAFMMYYQSDADAGLTEPDRRFLESVLEERFGYSLCLCHRDVLPGNGMCGCEPN